MGGCLLIWVVVNFIIMMHQIRKVKSAGLTAQIQCEKCGTIYEVTGKEATRPTMVKYKKSSHTSLKQGVSVNKQNYSEYAKKFHCPGCNKKAYGKVLQYQELQYEGQGETLRELGKGFLRIFVGGGIIFLIMFILF